MFRPVQTRPGPGDFLAAAIVVIGLTILFLLTGAHLLVAFHDLSTNASELARGDPELLRICDEHTNNAVKFVGLTVISTGAVAFALASIPPLRSRMGRIGLIRSSNRKTSAKSPNRPLRIYLKMLGASAILAAILYALMLVGILLSDD
jgi:hypothetical protein